MMGRQVAQGALRHGVLQEMLTRDAHATDARDTSVQRLAQKFAVDAGQAARVSRVAARLLAQVLPDDAPDAHVLQRKLRKVPTWPGLSGPTYYELVLHN